MSGRHRTLTCPPGSNVFRGPGVEIDADALAAGLDEQARMGWTVVCAVGDALGEPRWILLRQNPPKGEMK